MSRIVLGALLLTACTAQPASTGEPANAASVEPVAASPAAPAPSPAETAPVTDPSAGAAEPTAECDASKAEALVGREASEANGAEAKRLTGARAVRWIRPGQAVTMDYSPSRLNITVDANERIEGFSCG